MTSFEELLSTRDVPVILRARRWGVSGAGFAWARAFAAAAAQSALTIVVMLGLLGTVPAAFGQISTTVMSDSMEPGLRAGDVVIVRPMTAKQVRIGQVLLVDDPDVPGRLRLHRLADIRDGNELLLKGDANRTPDGTPVAADKLLGAGWLRVPYIGLPVYWVRNGQYLPIVGAAAVLIALAALASSDRGDDIRHRRERTPGSERRRPWAAPARWIRRLRRRKGPQAGAALLLAVGLVASAGVAHPQAAAAFNSVTTSPGNSLGTGNFDCPPRPIPATNNTLYYSYMTASNSVRTEPDVSGSTPLVPGTLGSGATRVAGNCSNNGGSSPTVSVDGTSNGYVVANSSVTLDTYTDVALWFYAPSTATKHQGVLSSLSSNTGSTPTTWNNSTTGDMQMYFNTGGQLTFQIGRPGNPIAACSVSTLPATGAWHLAVMNFSQFNKRFDLYLDGSTQTCGGTVNTISTTSGYWRFGSDVPLDTSIPAGFIGQIDETAVYKGAYLSASTMNTIYSNGH